VTKLPSYATLLNRYLRKHGNLVQPRQGWGSLHSSLHLAYSMARVRKFTDLGTYVNKPLDHGWRDDIRMARAFDLGREDKRFWQRQYGQLMTWRYVRLLVKNHVALGIDYVIYRDKIWSRNRGWHRYGPDRSHFWHIHVSGSIGKDL
jgi:hypothetical protein